MIRLDGVNSASELWDSEDLVWGSNSKYIGGFYANFLSTPLWGYFDYMVYSVWYKSFLVRNYIDVQILNDQKWLIDIESLLGRLFSKEFILKNNLLPEVVLQKFLLSESEYTPENLINTNGDYGVFALMEEREGFKVSLIITPHKRDLKVALTGQEDKGIRTVVESYFYDEFDPYDAFNNILKNDELSFLEQQGWPHYPMAYNNEQFFKIHFNMNKLSKQSNEKVGTLSSLNQLRFLDNFLHRIELFFGNDVFNSKEKDVNYFEDVIGVFFRQGRRIYSLPNFDLVIIFDHITMKGRKRANVPIGLIDVRYVPRLIKSPPKGSCYLHPMVYEAGK